MNYVFEITQLLVIKEKFMPYSRENKGELIQNSRGFWTRVFSKNAYFRARLIQNVI